MPAKTVAKKKAVASKTVTAARKTTRAAASKRAAKSDKLVCETCGLSLIVDEWGDVYGEELICCGVPMKQKARRAKAAAK
jgi:predicted amidohydrolase